MIVGVVVGVINSWCDLLVSSCSELDADFLPWSLWSSCSVTCGERGVRARERTCRDKHSANCIGPRHDSKKCLVALCPGL